MKKIIGVLFSTTLLLTGCVTYNDGEPVKDDAYEKRQDQKENKTNNETKEKESESKTHDEAETLESNLKEKNKNIIESNLYDEGMLIIKLNADGTFNENTLVTNQAYNILELMDIAFSNDDVETVDVVVRVTMVDNKGNESTSDAINIVYKRSTFEELNYSNFVETARSEEWRIYNESDEYLINPNIYANLNEDIKDNMVSGNAKF